MGEKTIKRTGDASPCGYAQRDSRESKGRCDLLPLEMVGEVLNKIAEIEKMGLTDYPGGKRHFSEFIEKFQREDKVEYLYNALAEFIYFTKRADGTKLFRTPYDAFLSVAGHYENGAKLYGSRNWELGMPLHQLIDSGYRHYLKAMANAEFGVWDDEPHDLACIWNILGAAWTRLNMATTHPELLDTPFYKPPEIKKVDKKEEVKEPVKENTENAVKEEFKSTGAVYATEYITPIKVDKESRSFLITNIETSEEETVQEFDAVILHHQSPRYYFKTKADHLLGRPSCETQNGIIAEGEPGGDCFYCVYSGKEGFCFPRTRIYLKKEGYNHPLKLSLCGESSQNFKNYIIDLLKEGKKSSGVITTIKITHVDDNNGDKYPVISFSFKRNLTESERLDNKTLHDYRVVFNKIKEHMDCYIGNEHFSDDFHTSL